MVALLVPAYLDPPHSDGEDRQGSSASAFQHQLALDPGSERAWEQWEEGHSLRGAEPHCKREREGGCLEAGGDYVQETESKAALGYVGGEEDYLDLDYETGSYWEPVEGDLVKPEVGDGLQAARGSAVAK